VGPCAIVRFHGGAQAAHNVVTPDGRHHTFAQLGSGSFVPGVKTLLSRHVVVDPPALLVEEQALRQAGVRDAFSRLLVHPEALVATPYHRARNQARERMRGTARHGSCGVGFGEAVEDALRHPDAILRARDLREPGALHARLAAVREESLEVLRRLGAREEVAALGDAEVGRRIEEAFGEVGRTGVVVSETRWEEDLRTRETLLFEGAQGVLLCERHGLPPHTTWSRCDLRNAREILAGVPLDGPLTRIGVLRAFAVRHGAGPLPTETAALAERVGERHNRTNDWQGAVRYGWLDLVLSRYAIAALGGVDGLAATHMDVVEAMPEAMACEAYRLDGRRVESLAELVGPEASDTDRARVGERLARAEVDLKPFAARPVSERLGVPTWIEARGPTADDVKLSREL
jgi:adenylosuccinate synthase